jgi:MFS family permease
MLPETLHIPEKLCKDHLIQKQLAKTAGLVMLFRMFAAILGAVPLGQLADRRRRKIVLVLHKLNVVASSSTWLLICNVSFTFFVGAPTDSGRLAVPIASDLDIVLHRCSRAHWRQLRARARNSLRFIH